ncbi:MAG TPA: hypothetical protein VF718_11620 [Allosphingosinicella sp.]|jgi:uncharacterized membrane-anchored protein
MNLTVSDLAPIIVLAVVVPFVLFLVWLAVRQAHNGSGKGKRKRPDPTAAE